MISHDYARLLIAAADRLYRSKPFEVATEELILPLSYDKDKARGALLAIGSFDKDYSESYYFSAVINLGCGKLKLRTVRNLVCKRVTRLEEVERWECDSILAPEEEEEKKDVSG